MEARLVKVCIGDRNVVSLISMNNTMYVYFWVLNTYIRLTAILIVYVSASSSSPPLLADLPCHNHNQDHLLFFTKVLSRFVGASYSSKHCKTIFHHCVKLRSYSKFIIFKAHKIYSWTNYIQTSIDIYNIFHVK